MFVWIQKQKQTEEEYGKKLQELQAELASSNKLWQKLERNVCTQLARQIARDKKSKVIVSNRIFL